MRKTWFALLLVLSLAPLATGAGPRTETSTYVGCCRGIDFEVLSSDATVSVSLDDVTDTEIRTSYTFSNDWPNEGGPPRYFGTGAFCGSGVLAVPEGAKMLWIFPMVSNLDECDGPALPTVGKVTASFT